MWRLLIGFVGGVYYGVVIADAVPDGVITKVFALLKMLVFG